VGALGVRKGVLIEKIQLGGEQEFNLRAGTHNVPGIVGLAAAVSRISNEIPNPKNQRTKNVSKLRDYFWEKIQKEVTDIKLNGSLEKRVANNLNVSFAGVEGESMLLALDMVGIACSTGSACSSESLEPSHVLMSMGLTHPEAHGSLRFTLGEGNTEADLDYATLQIKNVVEKLRKVSGYKS
jgi:cysteine desulfurase